MLGLYQVQDLRHTNVNCLDMLIVLSALGHVPRGEDAKAEEVLVRYLTQAHSGGLAVQFSLLLSTLKLHPVLESCYTSLIVVFQFIVH